MVFTACQEDALVENQPQGELIYSLSAQVNGGTADSRAQIQLNNPLSGEEFFYWNESDSINIYQNTGKEFKRSVFHIADSYTEPTQGASKSATFNTTTPVYASANYLAFYPAERPLEYNELPMRINNELYFNEDNHDKVWGTYFRENMYMMDKGTFAGTDNASVSFKQLCSLFRISYVNCTSEEKHVNSFKFTSNGSQLFSEECHYHADTDEMEYLHGKSELGVGTDGLTVPAGESTELYALFFPNKFGDGNLTITLNGQGIDRMIDIPIADIAKANPNDTAFVAGKRYWFKITETEDSLVWTKNYTDEPENSNVVFTNKELSKALYDYLEVQGKMPGAITFDADSCAVMSPKNVAEVKTLSFRNINLPSLDGIGNFKNLTSLTCYRTGLTSCDLSQNTALQSLNVQFNSLTALDLNKNIELQELYCSNNPKLVTLDITNCTFLHTLRLSSTALTSVTIPNPENIGSLEYGYTNLSFNLKNFVGLYQLDCSGIGPDVLDFIPDNLKPQLVDLACSANNLISLDLSKYVGLRSLNCDENELTQLDLSSCTKLEHLNCYGNQLDSLDVSGCTELFNLICSDNKLKDINLKGLVNLKDLDAMNNKLTSLNAADCSSLMGLQCFANNISTLGLSSCTSLEHLACGEQRDSNGNYITIKVKLAEEVAEMWNERWSSDDFNRYVEIVDENVNI